MKWNVKNETPPKDVPLVLQNVLEVLPVCFHLRLQEYFVIDLKLNRLAFD